MKHCKTSIITHLKICSFYKLQVDLPNWDCLFITAMKAKANTAVYPLNDFTEEDIEEYLNGKM